MFFTALILVKYGANGAIPCLFLATVSIAALYMLIAFPWSVFDLYLGFLAASLRIAKASLSVF